MGHWNTQFPGHFLITDEDGQGHSGQQPEPSSFYGNVPNVHHPPNILSLIPPPNNFSFPLIPQHRDNSNNAFFNQYCGFPTPQADLDVAIPPQPSDQFIPYTADGESSSVQGANEHLNPHYGGVLRANFPSIAPLLEYERKRKSSDMALPLFPLHNPSGGPSSSSSAAFSAPYENYVNGPEGEHSRSSMSSRPDAVAQEGFIPYSADDPVGQGCLGGLSSSAPYPWSSDLQFGASSGDPGAYLWPPAPSFPYMTANPNGGARVEAGSGIGLQQGGYQLGSSYGFMPPPAFARVSPYLPSVQGSSMGYGIVPPYQNNLDASPALFVPPPVAPAPTGGIQLFGHRWGEPSLPPSANPQLPTTSVRHYNDDEAAAVIPPAAVAAAASSQETEDSDDQHNDLRMDIDDMSYEELLALEEEIGQVATGLTEEFIEINLRSRTITLSEIGIDLEDIPSPDHQINLCTVCQNEYEGGDTIGSLDCGHEYHTACIKQWLVLRNTCPVCKATALTEQQ